MFCDEIHGLGFVAAGGCFVAEQLHSDESPAVAIDIAVEDYLFLEGRELGHQFLHAVAQADQIGAFRLHVRNQVAVIAFHALYGLHYVAEIGLLSASGHAGEVLGVEGIAGIIGPFLGDFTFFLQAVDLADIIAPSPEQFPGRLAFQMLFRNYAPPSSVCLGIMTSSPAWVMPTK